MKLRTKLSVIVITIIAAVTAVSSVITLRKAADIAIESAYGESLQAARSSAKELENNMESYLYSAKTLAQMFGEYYSMPAELRRAQDDSMMRRLLAENKNYTGLWTAWFPGTLDGLDDQLGQYATLYTRRNGRIEKIPGGNEGWQDTLANLGDEADILPPVWRNVEGYGSVPVITIIHPIKNGETGETVGLVGINFTAALQSITEEIGKSLYGGAGVAAVYTNEGVTLAHYDKEHIGEILQDSPKEKVLLGDHLGDVVKALKNGGVDGQPYIVEAYSPHMKTNMHLIYYPIKLDNVKTTWSLMVGIPMGEVTGDVRNLTIFTIIFAAVMIIIAGGIVFFAANHVAKPIISVSRTLKDISEGEGDLTRTIPVHGHDEVADLARYFNLTLEKIRNLVGTIKQQSANLSDIGSELASNMTESAAAVKEITSNIQSIKGRVINQTASVTQTNATMEHITGTIDRLNGQVESQTNSVTESSSAIEEMIANIHNVTATLIKNAENVAALTEASELGRTGLTEVTENIRKITEESEGLMEINAVMQSIAAETNLLSMNAAIEAAHAGEAGKGFAVVANEIRKLAESSGVQSKTIAEVLKQIKASIDSISRSAGSVLDRFEAIDNRVKTVADQTENIRSAMEEQGEGSKQILHAITRLNEITAQVRGGSSEMLEGSREVIHESRNLEMVSQEISGGMNEMAAGAEQINTAVHRVNELTGRNRQNIDRLIREVSRFKIA
jgi:methyl-accepting chemotaxis protein